MNDHLRGKSILIVEDDSQVRNLMKVHLEKAGFEVMEAEDSKSARRHYLKYDPCFVILDLILPDEDGNSLCQWMRSELNSNVPIMIVSADSCEESRIKGLRQGADDFLPKPFSLGELVARVETILRRTANRCSKISFRGLTIKPIKREVRYEDNILDLTLFEYKLLLYLMQHANQILSREQIINKMYENGEKQVSDRTVDVHVTHLRNKIGRHSDYTFIETVRGLGYRFLG
ncbi:response regulator transcription factor [Bacillus testis]|uniref:response regulator transcription factor n=1 Tax=Bacillus testis TaxID=1622072 RepID=UPI00067EC93C|nr:response regulator transcription factor [Bacillus testis]